MKKIAAILLTVLMVISFAACEGNGESAEEIASDTGNTTEVTSTEIDFKETNLPGNESTKESTVDVKTGITYDGIFPEHEPYGTGIGAMPGRVVWAHDPDSVFWDGSGYWWETDHFDEALILQIKHCLSWRKGRCKSRMDSFIYRA